MARKSKVSTDHILHYSIKANGTTWLAATVDDIILTFHGQLMVSEAARVQVLANLHIQHTSISKNAHGCPPIVLMARHGKCDQADDILKCGMHGLFAVPTPDYKEGD